MYKIIISSLCVLLGFAACRSGKQVIQAQNKETAKEKKDIVQDSINRIAKIDSEINAFLKDTSPPLAHPTLLEKEKNKKFCEELKTGVAYNNQEMKKYVLINDNPPIIKQELPNILLYYEENIIGQSGIHKRIGAAYNDELICLPNCINRLFDNFESKSINTQLNMIISIIEYPFPIFSIGDIVYEEKQIMYGSSTLMFNYTASGIFEGEKSTFYAFISGNKTLRVAIFKNGVYYLAIDTTL